MKERADDQDDGHGTCNDADDEDEEDALVAT